MQRTVDSIAILLALAGALALVSGQHVVAQQKSAWDGSYSEAQAKRGAALYTANCSMCHGNNLSGGERAPALAGNRFQGQWNGRPTADLLDYMQVQMPLQSPGGLTRHQNADLLAFILQRNGAAAGQKELWIEGPEGGPGPVHRSADYNQIARPSTKRSEALYTLAQAKRGQIAFNRNCAFCHRVDPQYSTAKDLLEALPTTFGGHFIERVVNGKVVYPSVLQLFSKLQSMPATNTKSITDQQRVDIVAYILQANGLPAGNEEIPLDTNAMRLMMLNEPGFERLFNGKDFAGWNFQLGSNCQPAPDGCARTEPGEDMHIENQTIVCECNIHGIFYTDKKYKDFTLRFDTKFEKPRELGDNDDEELFSGGGGYLIFTDIGAPGYPKSIEVEGRHRDMLEFYAIGGPGKVGEVDLDARRRAMHPLGQWNSIEIVAKNQNVKVYLNGVFVSEIKHHDYTYAGNIAFQSQGSKMYWRNVRIKAE